MIDPARPIDADPSAMLAHVETLLREKQLQLDEMRHRIANSLQVIASILMLKARATSSDETRDQLCDAHHRVLAVAMVQQHLRTADGNDETDVEPYLTTLCAGLADAMVSESRPVVIRVKADRATIASADAVSIGLIVTELVINALKHAFPIARADAAILIVYEVAGEDWRLIVSDNGIGRRDGAATGADAGLGTTIVNALARQLGARVDTPKRSSGLAVTVSRETARSGAPRAA